MRTLIAAALLVCFVPAALPAGDENPFKKAKVGDWAEYKLTGLVEGKTKMTILSKNDKEVTYESSLTISFGGKETVDPPRKVTVDLTKPHDALSALNLKVKDAKTEILGEGKEKITAGGKEYDTKWTKSKTTAKVNGKEIMSESKVWICNDVPIAGVVKVERTTTTGASLKLELINSGRK